ncbi:MAG TPA: class I SAM-dependent methyltransferase [Planctomycetes bacterium]|nr:class I SAM-dependent methyltransferase [Planctomycetota bacterium]HIJ71234.1 class I SAM-dependent methyltransferase [Planctomycetota bacterium]
MEKVYVAKWYHMILYPDWLRSLHQRPKKFLAELVKPGMTAADIGCGLGFYALELAKMVGRDGRVLAVDFQSQMLNWAKKKARRAQVLDRIKFIQCSQDDLKISEPVDFVLSMWMVHEVPDRERFFRQIRGLLKPDGKYLLAEPKFHVTKQLYDAICDEAQKAGLTKISEPRVGASFAALFAGADRRKPGG